ncbi:MAG: prolyl oligopeptidase family serine peptidase [bacterium]|nr:prolyl oligopeptidase family serine peptidase [bacterium]
MSKFLAIVIILPTILHSLHSAFLSSIEDTIYPHKWLYAGPFSIGAREGIIGVLGSIEGFVPEEGVELPSILVQGGKVFWKSTEADSLGRVILEYKDVWWDTLQDIYGIAGVLSASYAWSKFQNNGDKRALAIVNGVGSFRLNGKVYPGNPYGDKYMVTPVLLKDRDNEIFVTVSGFGDEQFSFKFIPVASPLVIIHDATLPDIIEGELLSSWVGVSLLNTTENRLNNVEVRIGGSEYFKLNKKEINNIQPLCIKKVPLKVELICAISELKEVWLPIKVIWEGEKICEDSLKLRVRSNNESYKITFISKIDNSVQYFAILPPLNFDKDRKYALILTLHGAGVEAHGQVDAYTPKDWAFIVAPTNRRPFGFDWHDWGRLDALEVLNEVKARFPIDENRVYLTGHSMGGHGAWHIGTVQPDLFSAIAPSAGWSYLQLYVPWTLQKSELFSHPSQLAPRDMVIREDVVPVFLENALNLPIFVLQGGADNNVPPVQARILVSYLKEIGYPVHYMEVPGKGHWWDESTTPGIDCVDHSELIGFLKNRKRTPYPKHVIFKLTDIGLNNQCYWVRIDEQELLYHDSRIEANVKNDSVWVFTENIKAFTVNLVPELVPVGKINFVVDGRVLHFNFKSTCAVSFYKQRGRFTFGETRYNGLYKTLQLYGPMKQAYFTPFVLVYGTIGDSTLNHISYHNAWLQAWMWWHRANGFVELLPDTEITDVMIKEYNLILFGGPEVNSITKRINSSLPIRIKDNSVWLGKDRLQQKSLALQEIYPNPLNPNKFVILYAGTNIGGEKLSCFFSTFYSGAGIPDFVIYDHSVQKKGWAGVVTAGFFNQHWQLDKTLFYSKE